MSSVPENLQYTGEHEWVAAGVNTNAYRIGITDFAQSALGDIVYIQLPKLGSEVTAGAVCGEIESTKSVSEIYSPLTGRIVAVNGELDSAPESINADPYNSGWIAEIEIEGAVPTLMTPEQYRGIIT